MTVGPGGRNADDATARHILGVLRAVAVEAGASPAQAALARTMDRPGVASTLIGARKIAQLEGDLAAADLHLAADRIARLTDASAPAAGFTAAPASPGIRRTVFGGNDVAGWGDQGENGSA